MSIRQHDFTLERRFRQTPEQAFQAFADPALKQRWFGVPDGWADAEWSLDFRVGGGELSAGRDRGGTHHLFRSRFHDIVDGERIVFAYDLLLDDRLVSVSLTTVQLRPDDGGGTHLIFTEHGAFLDGLEDPAEREHGTGLLLDGLEAFFAGEVPE
ncbi:MAG TPA: SRPBCC family protein [Baekduia sp.]|uniref:SRPBCC family protein n=1 Tax=Baekduia sp. TaxID=2600305 RepID=UPI002B6DDFE8|nr:SRPBCC family protein [Baekduia sp.]HMJ33131.1 SRPBCC family protein [Baekduia sp.]